MSKIYLAIPYSGLEEESFAVVNKIAAKLMAEGHIVFSPISHTHPIALAGDLPKGWDYWKKFDETFIDWCEILYIVVMKNQGFERIRDSVGVNAEHVMALNQGKRILHVDEEMILKEEGWLE